MSSSRSRVAAALLRGKHQRVALFSSTWETDSGHDGNCLLHRTPHPREGHFHISMPSIVPFESGAREGLWILRGTRRLMRSPRRVFQWINGAKNKKAAGRGRPCPGVRRQLGGPMGQEVGGGEQQDRVCGAPPLPRPSTLSPPSILSFSSRL